MSTDEGVTGNMETAEKKKLKRREAQARYMAKETPEERELRLLKQRVRNAKNKKKMSAEQKQERREKNRQYMADRLKRESSQQRDQRLQKVQEYGKNKRRSMTNAEWDTELDKRVCNRVKKSQTETYVEWSIRRYNARLNYKARLSKLSEDELREKRDLERQKMADKRKSATEIERNNERLKNRLRMRKYRDFYERQSMDRDQRRRNFEEAKRHKLLPSHSSFDSDTGSLPFLTYIIRNKLMYNHDPYYQVLQDMIAAVNYREMRRKWGKLVNYKYVIKRSS